MVGPLMLGGPISDDLSDLLEMLMATYVGENLRLFLLPMLLSSQRARVEPCQIYTRRREHGCKRLCGVSVL